MRQLNGLAAAVLADLGPGVVQACTDVTGFGLVGHATEVARASGVTLRIDCSTLPWLPGVLDLARSHVTGGAKANREHFESTTSLDGSLSDAETIALYDPQTSGGLFAVLSPDRVDMALESLARAGVEARVIGRVGVADGAHVRLTGTSSAGATLADGSPGMV
jgi:selenide,water dikinase